MLVVSCERVVKVLSSALIKSIKTLFEAGKKTG
jgi:hypothetical protein